MGTEPFISSSKKEQIMSNISNPVFKCTATGDAMVTRRLPFEGEYDGFSGVRDFISVDLFNFPVFNIADTFIVIGVFLLLIETIRKEHKNDNRK